MAKFKLPGGAIDFKTCHATCSSEHVGSDLANLVMRILLASVAMCDFSCAQLRRNQHAICLLASNTLIH